MALSALSLPSIDPFMWHVVMPFPVGLLASGLFYRRLKTVGRQAKSFSPAVASILTTPLLAVAYYLLVGLYYAGLPMLVVGLVLSAPISVSLLPLLVICLRGGFRRRRIFGIIVSAISVGIVTLQFFALYVFGLALGER